MTAPSHQNRATQDERQKDRPFNAARALAMLHALVVQSQRMHEGAEGESLFTEEAIRDAREQLSELSARHRECCLCCLHEALGALARAK